LTLSYPNNTHRIIINLGSEPAPFIETPIGRLVAYGIPIAIIIAVIIAYTARKKTKKK
jgi:hypothetical protein